MENLKKRLDVALSDNDRKDKDISKALTDVDQLKEEKREVEKDREKKASRIKGLESDLMEQGNNIQMVRLHNSELNRKTHELDEKVTKQAAEINEKGSKLSSQEREINKLKRDKETIKTRRWKLKEQRSWLKPVLSNLRESLMTLRS